MWGGGIRHGLAEYDSDDHKFSDMTNDGYFATICDILKAGDYIRITDCEHTLHEIHIDEVDEERKTVRFSILRELHFLPVVQEGDNGLAVRWKGPHRKWCVIDASGGIAEDKFATRELAERALIVSQQKAA
jgi:hypothetical protein